MMRFVASDKDLGGKTILRVKTLEVCGVKHHKATFMVLYDSFCIMDGICTGEVRLADSFRPLEWDETELVDLGIITTGEYASLVALETQLELQSNK